MININNIFFQSLGAVKWSYAYTILPKFISLVVHLILAKLLSPSDFGLVAIASIIIALVEVIRETGFSKAFIQRVEDDESLLFNTVFWMSICVGCGFYLIIFFLSPLIAKFFHNPDSIWVIRIMGVQMILSSLNTCHNSILIKKLKYEKLLKASLLPTISPLFITVPLAYLGFNVWALVIGYLSSSLIRTFSLWYFVPIELLFKFDILIAKNVLNFGLLCSVEALLGWFYVWGDKAIVGHFLDINLLGLYTMASMITALLYNSFFAPLSISYPLLCSLKGDKATMQFVLYKLFHIISSVSLLLGILVFFNTNLIPYLFGEKWKGIELPLGILAITQSLSYIITITVPDALKAIDRADIMPKFQFMKLIYTMPLFIVGAKFGGLIGFCYAKLATVILGFFIHFLIGIKFLGPNWGKIFKILYPKTIAVIITIITFIFLKSFFLIDHYVYTMSIINSVFGIVIYFSALAIADKKGVYDLIRLTKWITIDRQINEYKND